MNNTDGRRAFTMAICNEGNTPSRDDDCRCCICGKKAVRTLRFTGIPPKHSVEMQFCLSCWRRKTESGEIRNPLQQIPTDRSISPFHLINHLNLTELPLSEALDKLYGVCGELRGGCIAYCGSDYLPLVGPVRIHTQSLSSVLDSMLGPVGLKWDIVNGVILIASTSEELEWIKKTEFDNQQSPRQTIPEARKRELSAILIRA